MEGEQLAERCRKTAETARQAIAWFNDNPQQVGIERAGLVRDFRRLGLGTRKLEQAVARPMCVGVFGPSQSGKSYLTSTLARPRNGRPIVLFKGEERDFLDDINPGGEKESTGLVTRFTIHGESHPDGFPVCLRLLSEADIVKVLLNSFFLDGKPESMGEPPQAAEIALLLDQLRGAALPQPQPGIDEDDMWDMQEYLQGWFGGSAYLSALESFWEDASTLLPRLDPAGRAKAFSLLWGRFEPFTELFLLLADVLARLGHAADAFCPIDALIPRTSSIIDVATLAGLGGSGHASLAIRTRQGAPIELPRPVITALTAEIRMVLKEQPWPLFEHTDVLDFPGARSRQKTALASFFETNPEPLKECFMRGKVGYLFDRYVAEQELTSMLLCMPPGPGEVVLLPEMIADWVVRTHGPTPEERRDKPCTLFFVLTKSDMHLVDKAGGSDDLGERFGRRLDGALGDYYGRAHGWVREWLPGRAFGNCYWLRSPVYPADAVFEYRDGREVGRREDRRAFVAQLTEAYAEVPKVREHFHDPVRAFQAMLEVDDGGVSYLVENLEPICQPQLKLRQIEGRIGELRGRMQATLRRFHRGGDLAEQLRERLEAAKHAVHCLAVCTEQRRFGTLLHHLHVAQDDLADVFHQVANAADGDGRALAPRRAAPKGDDLLSSVLGGFDGSAGTAAPSADIDEVLAGLPSGDVAARYADAVLQRWSGEARRLAEHTERAQALCLTPRAATTLVDELIAGSRRLAMHERIAERVREALAFRVPSGRSSVMPAMLAAEEVNRYVNHLGFDELPIEERPGAQAGRPVFAPRDGAVGAALLGKEQGDYTRIFCRDWMTAFLGLTDRNARSAEGQTIDVEQNARVGALLETLAG